MKTISGNLLDIHEGVILHGVNAQGVMGSGIAKDLRAKYPGIYNSYRDWWAYTPDILGGIDPCKVSENLIVINGCTQKFYGRDPKAQYVSYTALASVFDSTCQWMMRQKLNKLYFPRIGAGLGKGDWNVIKAIILTIAQCYPTIEFTLVDYSD